jgi:hypothetical protein
VVERGPVDGLSKDITGCPLSADGLLTWLGRPAATSLGRQMHLDDDIVARALADIGEPSIPTESEFFKDTNSKS